jgi:hypothetical protein
VRSDDQPKRSPAFARSYEPELWAALVLWANHMRSIVEQRTKNCAAEKTCMTCMSGVDGERKFMVDGRHGYGSQ